MSSILDTESRLCFNGRMDTSIACLEDTEELTTTGCPATRGALVWIVNSSDHPVPCPACGCSIAPGITHRNIKENRP